MQRVVPQYCTPPPGQHADMLKFVRKSDADAARIAAEQVNFALFSVSSFTITEKIEYLSSGQSILWALWPLITGSVFFELGCYNS